MMKTLILGLALGALAHIAAAQHVEGTVTDERGEALAGATVFLEGTVRGDITDAHGRYAIRAPGPGAYLVVATHVGYDGAERMLQVAAGQALKTEPLILHEVATRLAEIVVEARRYGHRRRLGIFERDILGRTTTARKARITNPEVLTFTPTKRGFRAESTGPIIVDNEATGYRTHIFLHRYEHVHGTGGYRFAGRVFFEEVAAPTARQKKLRDRLYRGSMKHFLRAWFHGKLLQEGFYVHGKLEAPRLLEGAARAVRAEAILVEYDGAPDGAYRSYAAKNGLQPPFSRTRQVSRIAFTSGEMVAASNGFPIGAVRQEGYWAFRGLGDAVPAPEEAASSTQQIAAR